MRVCVFTGASRGLDPAHSQAAVLFGSELALRGHGLCTAAGTLD